MTDTPAGCAGALVGAAAVTGVPLDDCLRFGMASAQRMAAAGGWRRLLRHPASDMPDDGVAASLDLWLRDGLRKLLPPDAHERARGRLQVARTEMPLWRAVRRTKFDDRDDLIDCLVASCHIPLYSSRRAWRVRGQRMVDGGFTDNWPVVLDAEGRAQPTVTVSPFTGDFHICP
ncbi:MAG: hypothetical protein KIT58_20030, partial [Planctomycetota bacterium]|nr:hypothetical protein [Planctomycetota bacterium]